ncbi:uncharacterized protein LOC130930146 isoform X2 [Corythoichthys intestinalis]|uniref:uncharacterized protein LOC130930146 isoform X2 n=1 Tax=Corythoichthys intestinalis TaxID=161448 RepID=UPI0025A53710|nr:uncharacterized protein LOC130930146 isoform X2 [Corythoichthys intestinalis]
MTADAPRRHASCCTVAVVLLLCSLVPGFICFPWKALGDELGIRSGMWEQSSSELKEVEAEWRRTEPMLQCGPLKMIFKVTGIGAANLELDLGAGRKQPLNEVPESCGYSLHQNARGLVLVVPYRGCNVIKDNGYYVLPMRFLETSITLACSIHPTLTPKQQMPEIPQNVDRPKRELGKDSPSIDPYLHYLKYLYYLHIINNPHMYPYVQQVYNPLYQQHSDPHSQSYPYLPVHYPVYVHYEQNPAAPYCYPPGALCPLPLYFNRKPIHLDENPRKSPPFSGTTLPPAEVPTPPTTPPTPTLFLPTKKPFKRTVTSAPQTTTTTTTTTTTKRRCRPRTPPQDKNFTPYSSNPFAQEILYNEGGPSLVKPKSAPHTGYNSEPFLNYQYWQHQRWFPQEEDEYFDWDDPES